MPKGHRFGGILAMLVVAAPAMAQDAGQHMFKVSGFGTLGAVYSSEKNGDFTSRNGQPDGAGFTRSVAFGPDSKLGLQVDARFSDRFSAVVQGVSEYRYDGSYDPYLNMAQLKFKVTPSLELRAGRMPFQAYLVSDYQKVGYAFPWVRLPIEMYRFNPMSYFDGGDLAWQHNLGNVAFSGHVLGGSTSVKVPQGAPVPGGTVISKFSGNDIWAVSLRADKGPATYRVFYLEMKGTLDNPYLDGPTGPFALLRSPFLPTPGGLVSNPYYAPALADAYQFKHQKTSYLSFGYSYDPGNWFVMAEASRNAGEEQLVLHATSGYVTAGIRVGNWTPYLTAARRLTTSPTSNPNPIINALVSKGSSAQTSVSAGIRWDFMQDLDLKLQFDHVKDDADSYGVFINPQPGLQPGSSYNLATATLDFVF